MTFTSRISFDLPAEFGHRDVTPELQTLVAEAGVRTGLACVQLVGSTVGTGPMCSTGQPRVTP